jgi:hypothetical protein
MTKKQSGDDIFHSVNSIISLLLEIAPSAFPSMREDVPQKRHSRLPVFSLLDSGLLSKLYQRIQEKSRQKFSRNEPRVIRPSGPGSLNYDHIGTHTHKHPSAPSIAPEREPYISYLVSQASKEIIYQQAERRYQAKFSFWVAIILLVVGTVLITAGIICALLSILPMGMQIGVATSLIGIVINVTGRRPFAIHKDANDRYDQLSQELRNLTVADAGIHYIATYITDPAKKDEAIIDLVKRLQDMAKDLDKGGK